MPICVDRHAHKALWHTVLMVGVLLLSWMLPQVDAEECGDAQKGQRLYRYYCTTCHGSEGTGTGRNAPYLEQLGRAPRDHKDVWYMNLLSDAELYRAISEGKRREGEPPFTPWWGYTLTEQDIWNLVVFIQSLAREAAE